MLLSTFEITCRPCLKLPLVLSPTIGRRYVLSVPQSLVFVVGWLTLKSHLTLLKFDALPHACKPLMQIEFKVLHYAIIEDTLDDHEDEVAQLTDNMKKLPLNVSNMVLLLSLMPSTRLVMMQSARFSNVTEFEQSSVHMSLLSRMLVTSAIYLLEWKRACLAVHFKSRNFCIT